MIAHRISTFNGLLQFCRAEIRNYCRTYKLPPIPVVPDDGSMEPDVKAAFDFVKVRILISPKLLEYIKPHTETTKVWAVISAIRHELRHYEQYLYRSKYKQKITKNSLNQNEATVIGRISADSTIVGLSSEQINPILESVGAGFGLGTGFAMAHKLIDKVWKNPGPTTPKIYLGQIHNQSKRLYAHAYYGYLLGKRSQPNRKDYALGAMAAQAVEGQLRGMLEIRGMLEKNPIPKETSYKIFRVSDSKLVFAGNKKDTTRELKRLGDTETGYQFFYSMSETMLKNPSKNPSIIELTKGLTPTQKKVFLALIASEEPKSAYELGTSRMETMYALEKKGLIYRVPGDRLGTIFSPTTTIKWKSKFRRKV